MRVLRGCHTGFGKGCLLLYQLCQRTYARAFSTALGGAFAAFGRGSLIEPPVRLCGVGRIAIGKQVYIGASSWLHVGEPDRGTSVVIRIGDRTSIAGSTVLSAFNSIIIEDDVLIAHNVYIADHSHRYADVERPISRQGIDSVAPILIRSGAWLGQNVVICPGVTVGRGAVVGANSVVKSDVPDYCVAVGAPARVVRMIGKAMSVQ